MKIKPYTYYLGKSIKQLLILEHKKYNALTGLLVEDENSNATEKVQVHNIQYIYIDYALSSSTSIVMFDSSGRIMQSVAPRVINNRIFTIPNGVYSIAFNLDVNDYIDNLLDANFIYAVKECSPVYSKLLRERKKESEQEYTDDKLNGEISFFNDDYNFIDSIYSNYVFILTTDTNDTLKKPYISGYFNKTDCTIDTLRKKISVNLQTHDIYTLIKSKWTTEYNILDALQSVTPIKSTKMPVVQLYILGSSTVISFIGGNYIETDVEEEKNSVAEVKVHGFQLANAFSELEIQGCPIEEANGIYVGNLRSGILKLSTNPSYVIRPILHEEEIDSGYGNTHGNGNTTITVYVYRLHISKITGSTVEDLYISDSTFKKYEDYSDIWNYGTNNIKMVSPDGQTFFYTLAPIYYWVTCRVLADKTYSSVFPLAAVPPSTFASSGYNYRTYINFNSNPSSSSTFIDLHISGKASNKLTSYGKNDNGEYFIYDADSISRTKPISPVGKDAWANASVWVQPNDLYYSNILKNCAKTYTIKDCINIGDAIKALIKKSGLPITHEASPVYSQFLYGESWPGDIGTLQEDRFRVFICQRSNVLKSWYSQAAKKVELSLKEILDELAILFRCYWFIDSNNRLRIEHISYFMRGGTYDIVNRNIGVNLTTMKDQFTLKELAYAQQQVTFDDSEFASSYKFAWPAQAFEQFSIDELRFHDNYMSDSDAKEITSNIFTSDVSLMLLQADLFSKDDFALLCPLLDDSGYYLPIKSFQIKKNTDVENLEYFVDTLNGLASWNNLVYFYMWDMPGKSIDSKNLIGLRYGESDIRFPLNVKNIKRFIKQENVVFMQEDDIDMVAIIKTNMGDGYIEQLSTNVDTKLTTAIIRYEP